MRCNSVIVVLTGLVETHHQVESAKTGVETRGKGQSCETISCQARRATCDISQPNHGPMARDWIQSTITIIILSPTIITTVGTPTNDANGTTDKFTVERPQPAETKSNERCIIRYGQTHGISDPGRRGCGYGCRKDETSSPTRNKSCSRSGDPVAATQIVEDAGADGFAGDQESVASDRGIAVEGKHESWQDADENADEDAYQDTDEDTIKAYQ